MKWLALALLALVAVELGLWRAGHRTDDELRAAAGSEDPRAAAFALHVLANRGATVPLDEERVRALLRSEHAVLREYAMTWDLTRSTGEELQRAWLEGVLPADERTRATFFLEHQVRRPTLAELEDYLRALKP